MNNHFVSQEDPTFKSRLIINNTLKDFSSLNKKEIGEIFENITEACIANDEMASAVGISIENMFDRETAVAISNSAAQIYKQSKPANIALDLSEDDENKFKEMLLDM